MYNITPEELATAREYALDHYEDILHSLDCASCGRQLDALIVLDVLGWTPDTFVTDALARVLSRD